MIQRFKECKETKRKKHNPSSDKNYTPWFLAGLKRTVIAPSKESVSRLAERLAGMSSLSPSTRWHVSWVQELQITSEVSPENNQQKI